MPYPGVRFSCTPAQLIVLQYNSSYNYGIVFEILQAFDNSCHLKALLGYVCITSICSMGVMF